MKLTSLLLTAALSLAAASAYAQTAKSSPVAGASASPSTPPAIASAINREISLVEKEVGAPAGTKNTAPFLEHFQSIWKMIHRIDAENRVERVIIERQRGIRIRHGKGYPISLI